MTDSCEKAGRNKIPPAVAVALVAGLALILRLYRLSEQSIWVDEFVTVWNLSAPDAVSHHALVRINIPTHAMLPLYFLLQYYYAQIVGTSLLALRLFSVFVGVLSVLSLYLLGKLLYGQRAGLIAALCLALSPQHIWYSQEIRAYELVTLMAIFSVYCLFRALHGGRRWWWAMHFAVNALLPWTHTLSVLLLPAEGLLVLLVFRQRFRRVALWAGIHLLLLAPWTIWVLLMPYLNADAQGGGISALDVAKDVLAGDLVEYNTSLLPAWKTNPPELIPANPLLAWRKPFNALLLLALAGGMAWQLAQVARLLWHRARGLPSDSRTTRRAEWALFFLLLIVLPGLTLGILEVTARQVLLMPAYTMYNTIGLYIAVGAALSALRRPLVRVAAVAALALIYGYQLAIFLPGATRVDWRGAAQYIEAHGGPNDLVIDLQPCLHPGHCLEYYLKPAGYSVQQVNTLQAACDDTASFYERAPSDPSGPQAGRCAWWALATLPLVWNYPSASNYTFSIEATRSALFSVLQRGLAGRGLSYSCREFPGHFNLLLLRIHPAGNALPRETADPVPWLVDIDYDRLLDELGVISPNEQARQAAIAALRAEIPIWPPPVTMMRIERMVNLVADDRPDLAAAFARDTIRRIPDYALAHFALGLALAAEGKDGEADAALKKALELDWALRRIYRPFVDLLRERRYEALEAEEARLEQMGFHVLRRALRAVSQAKSRPPLSGTSTGSVQE